MYRKNEAAFEHDVRRFMKRNGQNIRNTPVWHTVPIRLFQLYLAVHERGGFQQVSTPCMSKDLLSEQCTTIMTLIVSSRHNYQIRNMLFSSFSWKKTFPADKQLTIKWLYVLSVKIYLLTLWMLEGLYCWPVLEM